MKTFYIAMVLVATNLIAIAFAIQYRDLYTYSPHVRTVTHGVIVNHYNQINPDRSAAYTCTTQATSSDGVGMVCTSPDKNIVINCTVGASPNTYFC